MKRPFISLAILLVLHEVGLRLMAHARLMECLLCPGESLLPLLGALCFLVLRLVLVFLGPGLALLAAWRWWTQRER